MGELLIILLIVLVVFGGKKLRSIGSDLGAAVKGFRQGLSGETPRAAPQMRSPAPDARFPEEMTEGPQSRSGQPRA